MRRVFTFSFLLVALWLAVFSAHSVSALAFDYAPERVGAGKPEVHIKRDGAVSIRSARAAHLVGTTLYLQLSWGQLPMRFLMKTSGQTQVTKKYGGASSVVSIKVGDYLDVDGDFFVGSDLFGVEAKQVKDWSLQEESETFSGQIAALLPAAAFTLRTREGKEILVQPATTSIILKGSVVISQNRLAVGDAVLFADGVYDYAHNTLAAARMAVFQDKRQFLARNYEGILMGIDTVASPSVMQVSVGGVLYRVSLGEKTVVQKRNKEAAELARFVAGDTVRFFGPLEEAAYTLRDERAVDAEVVRNLNL
ncbi:MAG: hypothetical protein Greene041679_328 [Parcubacteria group bacterium Greene0416_79]|nr:MAG: hypothetical protein Greene041679_328 [Parcubacteria group bacterium Greene0416_79]